MGQRDEGNSLPCIVRRVVGFDPVRDGGWGMVSRAKRGVNPGGGTGVLWDRAGAMMMRGRGDGAHGEQ